MGLFCCCLRPKRYTTNRKRVFEDRSVSNEVINDIPDDLCPSINSLLYKTPTIGLTEQNLFDLTVQKMAAKMINISALNDQLSQSFWTDRQKIYAKRVLNIRNPIPLRSVAQKARYKREDVTRMSLHERCTSMTTISKEDLILINKFSLKSSLAVNKVYNNYTNESFVVEFNPYID